MINAQIKEITPVYFPIVPKGTAVTELKLLQLYLNDDELKRTISIAGSLQEYRAIRNYRKELLAIRDLIYPKGHSEHIKSTLICFSDQVNDFEGKSFYLAFAIACFFHGAPHLNQKEKTGSDPPLFMPPVRFVQMKQSWVS